MVLKVVVGTADKVERIVMDVITKNSNQYDLEEDMYLSGWFKRKVQSSKSYSQNLYAAICNNDFQKLEVMPILKDQTWSASWRYAGGIVARLREEGDYLNWYCSGIRNDYDDHADPGFNGGGYVPEGIVTAEIREDLQKLGWIVVDKTKE